MDRNGEQFVNVLFDIDGVMLSEERYFDGSALTVYEILRSPQYLSFSHPELPVFRTDFDDAGIADIRRVTFANDTVFETVKTRGVNANWDMVYLQVAHHIAGFVRHLFEAGHVDSVNSIFAMARSEGWTREVVTLLGKIYRELGEVFTPDFASFNEAMKDCRNKADLFAQVDTELAHTAKLIDATGEFASFELERALWLFCQRTFQEWYLGDDYVKDTHQPGKKGFLTEEVPLVEPVALKQLFIDLKAAGVTLGIATGRPETETKVPLEFFGWLEEFDESRITTASDVLNTELKMPSAAPLAKPNPFSYLRSYLKSPDASIVLDHALPIDASVGEKTLIVGDSVADLLAARAMGCKFAAVLTGLEGPRARTQFEERGADYILDDAAGVRGVVLSK